MKTHHTYQSEFRQAESKLAVRSPFKILFSNILKKIFCNPYCFLYNYCFYCHQLVRSMVLKMKEEIFLFLSIGSASSPPSTCFSCSLFLIDIWQVVEKQKLKLKEGIPKEKLEKSRKYRLIEKEVCLVDWLQFKHCWFKNILKPSAMLQVLKRTTKYTDARLKATKVTPSSHCEKEQNCQMEKSHMSHHLYCHGWSKAYISSNVSRKHHLWPYNCCIYNQVCCI